MLNLHSLNCAYAAFDLALVALISAISLIYLLPKREIERDRETCCVAVVAHQMPKKKKKKIKTKNSNIY